MRSFALLLACWLLGACSLLVSTDDLASAAGTDAGGGAPDDAGADALASPQDGATLDGDAGPFCARRSATFCADFSSGGVPENGWSRSDLNGGALDIVVEGPSPPALRASLTGRTGDKAARLHHDLPSLPSEVHVEVDVLAAAAPPNLREVLKLELPTSHETGAAPGYAAAGLEVQLFGNELKVLHERFDSSGTPHAELYSAATPFPAGAWAHVELDAVLSTTNGSFQVKVDGASVISKSDVPTLPDEPVGARLVVGTFAFDLPAPTVDLFDNVLLDAK